MMSRRSRITLIAYVALFAAALCMYGATLNTGVQPADSGEFQIAAALLGIPHPPGYPLYTMLGWLFAQLPVASVYARISLFSAVTSALTLVIVCRAVQISSISSTEDGRHTLFARYMPLAMGMLAAIALGTSTTYWAQATTANIRSLTALFCAMMVLAWVWMSARTKQGAHSLEHPLWLFALMAGLGVGHHVSLVFVSSVLGISILVSTVRANLPLRTYFVAAMILLATQLMWIYLPLRDAAGARFAPGGLTTLDGLLSHILARGFAGDMLAYATPEFLWDRLAALPTLFAFEFSPLVLLALLIGVIWSFMRKNGAILVLVAACAIHLFITITYRAPQTVEYALPAWVIMCLLLGMGAMTMWRCIIAWFTRASTQRQKLAILGSVVWVLLLTGIIVHDGYERLPSFMQLARDPTTRTNAENVLRQAEQDGIVLAQWHQATAMWALQDIEGYRRDVLVQYVYPRGAQAYADTFAERAAEALHQHTTYVTSDYERSFAERGLHSVALSSADAWRICSATEGCNAQSGTPIATFDNHIELNAVTPFTTLVKTGHYVDVVVNWTATGSISDGDALTVRIMRPDGRLATNADLVLDPTIRIGETKSQRIRLGIPVDLAPGEYPLLVGAYRATSQGFQPLHDQSGAQYVTVATLNVTATDQEPVTSHQMNWTMSNGSVLIGVDYDTGLQDRLRVLTHWRLGSVTATLVLIDHSGKSLVQPRDLPAMSSGAAYFTASFDPQPTVGMRLALVTTSANGAQVTEALDLPPVSPGERYIPFADQMVLVGSSTWHDGENLKIDLRWLSARPIVSDYSVSTRVTGEGTYLAHDGIPALGALPTLKWIRGSLITDRHPIKLSDQPGTLVGTLVVYDAFTQQQLPPLDERYENGITFAVAP